MPGVFGVLGTEVRGVEGIERGVLEIVTARGVVGLPVDADGVVGGLALGKPTLSFACSHENELLLEVSLSNTGVLAFELLLRPPRGLLPDACAGFSSMVLFASRLRGLGSVLLQRVNC